MINLSASTPDQGEVLTRGKQYEAINTSRLSSWASPKDAERKRSGPRTSRRTPRMPAE